MKYLALLLLTAFGIGACNDDSKDTTHAHDTVTVDSTAITGGSPTSSDAVSLKKDGKWNADASTNKNVDLLQAKAAELNKQQHQTAADYHTVSAELQTGLNQLVKECKMKGADHDALHLWLEPLLVETKELKTVTDTVTGERLFHSIRTRLADYDLYFN